MVVVTYGLAGAPATDGRARPDRPTRLFARFMKALRDSRLRQARRIIERHARICCHQTIFQKSNVRDEAHD
jgi:hypothetical protein